MCNDRNIALIDQLLSSGYEQEWVEHKHNNADPKLIGELCSALSNSACIHQQSHGYCIWGIDDETKEIIGTAFTPQTARRGNQPLQIWLSTCLNPTPVVEFNTISHPKGTVVLMSVTAATMTPVNFNGTPYCRVGEAVTTLSGQTHKHQQLIAKLAKSNWEAAIAISFLSDDEVLSKLDYMKYFELLKEPIPQERATILKRLEGEHVISSDVPDKWNITNLGAILFAKELKDFSLPLQRKAIRLTVYKGPNKASSVTKRIDGELGYAVGFSNLLETLKQFIPENEHIDEAHRISVSLFPDIALRELILNALIHQDFTISGSGPTIDLFDNRVEISNPGASLIEPKRMIDLPPRSRNEKIAALMRRLGFCEESGSGIDKVIAAIEFHQAAPPNFRNSSNALQVILNGPKSYANMTNDERIRACYQHAVLKYLSGEKMKNESLRERFGITKQNASQASSVIAQTISQKLIKSADPARPRSGYLPFWA